MNIFSAILKIFTALGMISGTSPNEIQETMDREWLQKKTDWRDLCPIQEDKKEEVMPILAEIGCVNTVHATKNAYDYALVCGATVTAMQTRLAFLEKEIERGVEIGTIVFLAGKRMRFVDRESNAIFPGAENCRTEFELAQLVYEKSGIPREIPAIFIHGPMYPGVQRHVTTRGTLEDALISWGKLQPKSGTALFVTNQPYLLFQKELVNQVLPNQGIDVDCCAAAAGPKTMLATYLSTLARWGSWQNRNSTLLGMERRSGL